MIASGKRYKFMRARQWWRRQQRQRWQRNSASDIWKQQQSASQNIGKHRKMAKIYSVMAAMIGLQPANIALVVWNDDCYSKTAISCAKFNINKVMKHHGPTRFNGDFIVYLLCGTWCLSVMALRRWCGTLAHRRLPPLEHSIHIATNDSSISSGARAQASSIYANRSIFQFNWIGFYFFLCYFILFFFSFFLRLLSATGKLLGVCGIGSVDGFVDPHAMRGILILIQFYAALADGHVRQYCWFNKFVERVFYFWWRSFNI